MSLKVVKRQGKSPSELETEVSNAFVEIEKNAGDIKTDLEALHFVAAKEITVPGGKKAIVIFIPLNLLSYFRKVQPRLVRELEKKFSGKSVVIIPQRKIIHKVTKVNKTKRRITPRRNNLTAVNDALLDDVVYPTEIVAKRLRVRLDNSRLLKIYLDKRDQPNVESRLDIFAHVYHKLTKRNVQFLFPPTQEIKSFSFKKKQQVAQTRSPKFGTAVKKVTKAVKTGRFVTRSTKIHLRQVAAKRSAQRKLAELRKAKQIKKAENIKKAAELKKAADQKKAQKKAAQDQKVAKSSKPAKSASTGGAAAPAKNVKVSKPAAKASKPSKPVSKPSAKGQKK